MFIGNIFNYYIAPYQALFVEMNYINVMQVPNRFHHSKKAQKPKLKPAALRARKDALKALKRKLLAP